MSREFTEAPWGVHNFPGNYNGVDGWEITFHNSADIAMLYAAPAMYKLLKEMDGGMDCPMCHLNGNWDHAKDCRLAAVLKTVEGECDPPSTTD